jgi:hypothetical protein
MKANLELHIDKLLLDGFTKKDGFRIGKAIEVELSRLFQDQGIPEGFQQDETYHRLGADNFQYDAQDRPEQIGRSIANSIYNRFSKFQ